MDVNGTRFHFVNGEPDWNRYIRSPEPSGLWWNSSRGSLSLVPKHLRLPRRPGQRLLVPGDRRGADRDRYSTFYWIDPEAKSIRYLPHQSRRADRFWSIENLQACRAESESTEPRDFRPQGKPREVARPVLSGLAITKNHYLVVGTTEPAGLLLFDLYAGGPPTWLHWPADVPFAPFDIAPTADGGVLVLDRGGEGTGARYWRLDHCFRIRADDAQHQPPEQPTEDIFGTAGGTPQERHRRSFPSGISLDTSSPTAVMEAVAITALPDGSALVLESAAELPFSMIYRFKNGTRVNEVALDETVLGELVDDPRLWGHDFAFLPDPVTEPGESRGRLYVTAAEGNQTFLFDLKADRETLELRLRALSLPMRHFTGKALVAADGEVFYDMQERWLQLTAQPRERYATEGKLKGLVFDGKQADCVWHRLLLDACIPDGAALEIQSRAANHNANLGESRWEVEPTPYLRHEGSELPFHHPFDKAQMNRDGVGTWELLFQNSKGRFLELCLTLRGNGRATPQIRALRVYYPRFSYLEKYLPAVYQDDRNSAHFLDRFLANVEGLYTALESRIERAETLFDTRTAPAEYLEWLAGWLGTVLDPAWSDRRRRLFLDHAELLFRWRGTRAGLLATIRLAIGPCPDEGIFQDLKSGGLYTSDRHVGQSVRIVEDFTRRKFSGVVLGDPTDLERPSLVLTTDRWTPAHGAEQLHQRFREFLLRRYADRKDTKAALEQINHMWDTMFGKWEEIRFSPVRPAHPVVAEDWMRFAQRGLKFTYAAVSSEDTSLYQEFLARRYRHIGNLNNSYQLAGSTAYNSFQDIDLPAENALPTGADRLADWIQFVSLYLPTRRNAHKFTVLVPTRPDESRDTRDLRLAQVEDIVRREKPAHTNFDAKLFWALFQVGGGAAGARHIARRKQPLCGPYPGLGLSGGKPGRRPPTVEPPRPASDRARFTEGELNYERFQRYLHRTGHPRPEQAGPLLHRARAGGG